MSVIRQEPQADFSDSLVEVIQTATLAAVLAASLLPKLTLPKTFTLPGRTRALSSRRVEELDDLPILSGEIPSAIAPNFKPDCLSENIWQEIKSDIQHGKDIKLGKLQEFIQAIKSDKNAAIKPELLQHFLKHNTGPESQEYLCKMILGYDAKHLPQDYKKQALLEAVSSSVNHSPSKLLLNLVREPNEQIKTTAVETIIGDISLVEKFSIPDLVASSRALTPDLQHRGYRIDLAREVVQRLRRSGASSHSVTELLSVETSLMNTLEAIDSNNPELLQDLATQGDKLLEKFICSVIDQTVKERAIYEQRELFAPGVRLIAAVNADTNMKEFSLAELADRFGMHVLSIHKAREQETPREMKSCYLAELKYAASNSSSPLVVYHYMHGGTKHGWLYPSGQSDDSSDLLRNDKAVSYLELAECLTAGQIKEISQGKRKELDLSHITVILDACRQYSVARSTLQEINRLADRAGVKVKEMPLFLSMSQKERFGWFSSSTGRSQLQQEIYSNFDKTKSKFTVKDFLEIDAVLKKRMIDKLKVNGHVDPTSLHSEDPALFSPISHKLDEIIRTWLKEIGQDSIIHDFSPDGQIDNYNLEIGQYGQNSADLTSV